MKMGFGTVFNVVSAKPRLLAHTVYVVHKEVFTCMAHLEYALWLFKLFTKVLWAHVASLGLLPWLHTLNHASDLVGPLGDVT